MDPTHKPPATGLAAALRAAAGIAMISLCFGFLNYVSALSKNEPDPYAATELNPGESDIIEIAPQEIDSSDATEPADSGEPGDASGAFLLEDSSETGIA